MSKGAAQSDLSQARERAAALPADAAWRSLDELARTDVFREAVEREFPSAVMDFENDDWSRRNFLRLMGASMALAGVYGCSERPSDKIVPYVSQPEQVVPGMPLYFATAMPLNGYGYGVLAESHEGRPTKIEGNPDHPANLGGTNVFIQASILQLYDPERSRDVNRAGVVSTWESFTREMRERLDAKRKSGGEGIRILAGTITSPTLISQLDQFLRDFPKARVHHYDPLARSNTASGARQAFGRAVNTIHQFRRSDSEKQPLDARVIVSLDDDFLFEDPGSLRYARHFIAARQVRVRHAWQTTMNRLYMIESGFSLTGSMADHRIPLKPSEVSAFAAALANRLGVQGASTGTPAGWARYLDAMVADLRKPENKGETLIIAGESQPPEVHALVHAMNATLGNVGNTVYYTEPVERLAVSAEGRPVSAFESLAELTAHMNAGRVDTLLILGGNPAFTAPADVPFAKALLALTTAKQNDGSYTNLTAHLGMYAGQFDDTSYRCQWHLPEAHYLESWGDVRAFDGMASIIQPLIAPLHKGRSAIEVMDILLTPASQYPSRSGYELVGAYWRGQVPESFDAKWNAWLQKGVIENTTLPAIKVAPTNGDSATRPATTTVSAASSALEIVFRPDPSIGDGAFANNGWLQETPKFFTKLVWDNAALISPKTADALRQHYADLADGHVVAFIVDGRRVEAPVMLLPGVPEGVVIMHLGYGAQRGGSTALEPDGTPRGFNAYAVRRSGSPWFETGVSHESAGRFHQLVATRNHHAMDTLPRFDEPSHHESLKPDAIESPGTDEEQREVNNRKLVRTATLQYFNASEDHRFFVQDLGGDGEKKPLLSLYPGWDYSKGYQWGMSIDMQSCIGCNACMVACVSENNIAVVGREQVARQRDMHWIRIDQYFGSSLTKEQMDRGEDPLANPRVFHQPVPCMHCENAPCELVCPVGATVHSPEGLNEMVYNRCVGTRYCSNNCPYKVRRFNFFNYMKYSDELFDLQHNPQVTVRSRGVMEKCTYCVQRLTRTRIEIEKMIVGMEQGQKALGEERPGATPERQEAIDREIAEMKRRRHNEEFAKLENLQTACQQACPTDAIVFGSILPLPVINDQGTAQRQLTKVAKLKQEPTDYSLLADLTTKPRTTYMARLRNPNPELEPEAKA